MPYSVGLRHVQVPGDPSIPVLVFYPTQAPEQVAAFGPCSAACAAGARLGLASVYAPGHQQDGGTSGVAILPSR